MSENKLKVLVCAFACLRDPDTRFGFGKGGESGLGFNMVKQIAKFSDTFVLTDAGNKELIEKQPANNIEFVYIGLPWFEFIKSGPGGIQFYSYLWQIKAYFAAKALHKKEHFDVFHHITYANDWMASFIGALLPITYIRGPGGGAHSIPKAFLTSYTLKQKLSEKLRSLGQWCFRHDPFFIMGQNRAKLILVCNKEAFNALPKKWQQKAQFFPVNGIDYKSLPAFSPKNQIHPSVSLRASNPFLLFTAGKLLKLKSIDLAIKAFKLFNNKFPDSQFLIAGDGPELANLKALVEGEHLQGKVLFKTWMPQQELLLAMAKSNIFVFPSLRDGGGAVVVEAMAVGTPVICFNIAGPGFHIEPNWGIKIELTSVDKAMQDMVLAMEKLYINTQLRKNMGESASKRVKEFYDWDVLGAKLHSLYNNLL